MYTFIVILNSDCILFDNDFKAFNTSFVFFSVLKIDVLKIGHNHSVGGFNLTFTFGSLFSLVTGNLKCRKKDHSKN